MFRIVAIAVLAGFLFGYDTGIISGAVLFIKQTFLLNTLETETAVGIVLIGAMLGSLITGRLANSIGRKGLIEINAALFTFGAIGSAAAPTLAWFMAARFFVGFAIGIACYIAPLYISELSSSPHRGRLVAFNTIAVTSGIVTSNLVGLALAHTESWRWMLGMGALPALLLWACIRKLPESPRWLLEKGKNLEAQQVLLKLRLCKQEADCELEAIQENLRNQSGTLRELFTFRFRKLLVIGIVLACIQQITGINTVLYYAPILFQTLGYQNITVLMLLTLIIGLINLGFTFVAMLKIDQMGRRPLLFIGLLGMSISLLILSLGLRFQYLSNWLPWACLLSLFSFVAFYASSIGCAFWVIISEIYPLKVRGPAMGIASCANWGANCLINMTFLSLLENTGPELTFSLYSLMTFLSFLFCYFFVPETANRSLEEIEKRLTL